jgi:predicted dehydrogenase
MNDVVYLVTVYFYQEWYETKTGAPYEIGGDLNSVILGAYTDKERAIKVADNFKNEHIVKHPSEAMADDIGPIDTVVVSSVRFDPKYTDTEIVSNYVYST